MTAAAPPAGAAEGAAAPGPVRWGAVAVLAAGPDADLAAAAALSGAGAALSDASAVAEDGRARVSASGVCLAEAGRPAVVLTCAAALAPFLARGAGAAPGGRPEERPEERPQRPLVDAALVPTAELFVVLAGGRALPARLAACVPLPAAEAALRRLQAAVGAAPAAPEAPPGAAPGRPPVLGSLGVAVLHASLPEGWGAPLPAGPLGPPAGAAEGRAVRVCASPFGGLKPSLFLNTETRGCIAGWSDDGSLLLLDARCLPGSEGGVVAVEVPSPEATAVACAQASLPLALVAPPLRGLDGGRMALALAVPVSTVPQVLSESLPCSVVRALLGRGTMHGLLQSSLLGAATASPMRDTAAKPPDRAEAVRHAIQSLCVLTMPDRGQRAVALVLSDQGHVLVDKQFAVRLASSRGPKFECLLGGLPAIREQGPPGARVQGALLHAFEGISGLALLRLDAGCGLPPPLPWCLPPGAWPRAAGALEDGGAFRAGAEVWQLRLPAPERGARPRGPGALRGALGLAAGGGPGAPALLEAGFAEAPPPGAAASVLLRPGPPAALLALPLGAARELPRALPHAVLGLAAPQLAPLWGLLAAPAPGAPGALGALRRLDAAWAARARRGAAAALWLAGAEPRGEPLRGRGAAPRAAL